MVQELSDIFLFDTVYIYYTYFTIILSIKKSKKIKAR